MASYGERDYSEYDTSTQQDALYDIIGFGSPPSDPAIHDLFYDYYYNDDLTIPQRLAIWDELQARLEDEYGIDFENTWDWEAFRSWYDSAAA